MDKITFDPNRMDSLRIERGWSDLRLADEAGIHPQSLGNWRVRGDCSTGVAAAVAIALGVKLTDLTANGRAKRRRKAKP